MKKFRSLFLAVVIAAGSTPALLPMSARADATAPKTEKRRGSTHNQMEKVAQYLGLTDAQKAKIKPILEQAQQQSKAVRADTSLSPQQKRAKMKAIHMNSWQKINPILTDAQRQKLAALRAQRRQNAGAKSKK